MRESKLEVVGFTISMAILIMKNTNIYIYMYVHKKKLQHTLTPTKSLSSFLQSSEWIKKVCAVPAEHALLKITSTQSPHK